MMIPNFSKIGGFFEEHVEKIILAIVGALCAWLLITRVILSPNVVSYKDKKWSPAAIDEQIHKEAQLLRQKQNEAPQALESYKRKTDEYAALLDSSIKDIDTRLWPVVPYVPDAGPGVVRAGVYNLPRIPDVNGVDIEHIRAVAYVPIAEVTSERAYDKAGNEPNDLDLVTVSADIDIAALYQSFKEVFVEDVDAQWADPCLAKPVFAAVQLQRQERSSAGAWSDWQDVPRTKIDPHRRLFQIAQDVKDLPPGGLKVQMLQFDYKQVQIDLLQPEAYQIASADEEWYPPQLHRDFADYQRKTALEEKRQAQETEKKEDRTRDNTPDTALNRRPTTRTRGGAGGDAYGGAGGSMYGGTDARSRRGRGDRIGDRTGTTGTGYPGETGRGRGARGNRTQTDMPEMYDYGMEGLGTTTGRRPLKRPAIYDVYDKYDALRLTRLTEFEKLKGPLVFWAHDDTVEPGKTYQYRIRLGVFNPVAGTDRLSERDKTRKNDVILWSNYSGVTKPVEIMDRLYFFANRVRETDKAVTVQVSRLALGRWYSHDFIVQHGELIGEPLEPEPEKPDRNAPGGALGGYPAGYPRDPASLGRLTATPFARPEDRANVPEMIDYATGAVMVDAAVVNDWTGEPTLRTRNYYDMLYSFDGTNIEHMPVGSTYWDLKRQTAFSHIARVQREPQKPFKAFGTVGRRQRPGGEMMDEYYDEYMMEEMYMDGGMGEGRPLY